MSGQDVQVVRQDRVGAVLRIIIDNPPVNALGQAVRAGLLNAITAAEADPAISAIVISAAGRTFPVGADIAEFGKPAQAPLLAEVCNRIEACAKPVVAELHGTALGGGLELALAAHLRLALADARVGLPEVGLGILPGAGGTQRLPRLIGAEQALRLMLRGLPVPAAEALALGMLDRVVEADLMAAALVMAQSAARPPIPTRARSEGMRDPQAFQAAITSARSGLRGTRQPAPPRIVDCVEAAQLLTFDQGLAFERAAFDDLVASPEAAALRHAFFAERALARMPEAKLTPRPLQHLAVVGSQDAAPALLLAQAGHAVTLLAPTKSGLVTALEVIAAQMQMAVEAGSLTAKARDADWARITPAVQPEALAAADLLLLTDAMAVDIALAATRPGAVMVSLGSFGASHGPRAADMLRLNLPPPGGRLAEVIVAPASAPDAVATLLALLRSLGLGALRVMAPGGLGPRVMASGRAAAAHLVASGHRAEAVAAVLADFGLPGHQAGAMPDKAEAETIRRRVLSAMANEGARLVGSGAALRPSDIDAALFLAQGFPRWQGGPMHWADAEGLMVLRSDLRHWAEDSTEIWGVAPLIDQLIGMGLHFSDMNAG